jgi:hypothetical protein
MPKKKIALEYKNRHLDRPTLDGIVGAQRRAVPDATEIIVRCRSVTKTALNAVDSYGIRVTIVAREETPKD